MKAALVVIAVALVAVVGIGIALLADDEDLGPQAEQVVDDPNELIGEQVTLTGQVESFFPGAFTLGDSTFGDEVLVVPGPGAELPEVIRLRAGTPRVEVAGTVLRKGEGVELVPGEQFEPFDGQPYVRADRISVLTDLREDR